MDRRSFVRAGLAAVAAGAVVRPRTAIAQPTTGLDFDFTGLYAFQIGKTSNQLRVILVDGPAAGVEDEHAPLLVMRHEHYEPAPASVDPSERHHAPKIVRLGGQVLAVWSLAGRKLWMGAAHTAFDGKDPVASLTVDDSPLDNRTQPDPLYDPDAWRSMKWFAEYEYLLGGDYEGGSREIAFDPKCIASMIRLTRGHVSGRMPLTRCERERTYTVEGGSARTFNSQFHCVYPHDEGTALFTLSPTDAEIPRYFGVKVTGGQLTPISILNTSLTHFRLRHYEAFYGMACSTGKCISFPASCEEVRAKSTVTGGREPQRHGLSTEPDAPDPDCIPPRARLV